MYVFGLMIMSALLGYSAIVMISMTQVEGDRVSKTITGITFAIVFGFSVLTSAPQMKSLREFGLDLFNSCLTTYLPFTVAGAIAAVIWLLYYEGAFAVILGKDD